MYCWYTPRRAGSLASLASDLGHPPPAPLVVGVENVSLEESEARWEAVDGLTPGLGLDCCRGGWNSTIWQEGARGGGGLTHAKKPEAAEKRYTA